MNQQYLFFKEKEKAIRKATLNATKQTEEQKLTAIEAACKQESEKCRSFLEHIEELKRQLKKAKDNPEKVALNQALKEASGELKQIISNVKKETKEQKNAAVIREKETIARIKEEEKQALASLKDEEYIAENESANDPEYATGVYDSETRGIDRELEERFDSEVFDAADAITGKKADTLNFVDKGLSDDNSNLDREHKGEQVAKKESQHANLDDIRRDLEESVRRLEEERRARMDFELPVVPDITLDAATEIETVEKQKGVELEKPDVWNEMEFNKEELKISATDDDNSLLPDRNKEPAILHEGQINIVIKNAPYATLACSLVEKLKQVEGVSILLIGGTADAGLQVVVKAQKPVPLIDNILKLAHIKVTNYKSGEIYLEYKPDTK